MITYSFPQFLHSLPPLVIPQLSPPLPQAVQVRQPFKWLVQFHFGEPRLHYEVSRVSGQAVLELGLHFEATDSRLNGYLCRGFDHHLVEIQHTLGGGITAEPWDNGWAKVYELYPAPVLDTAGLHQVATRMAQLINGLHPFYAALRGDVAQVYR